MDFKKLACVLALSFAGLACSDDDPVTGDSGRPDGSGADSGNSCATGNGAFYVVSRLNYGNIDMNMKLPGFNLDGVVSQANGTDGCGIADGVSPAGVMGIDNQLGPTLASLSGMANSPLNLGQLVGNGTVLILADLQNVDDYVNDPCVNVTLLLGLLPMGTMMPMTGTDGALSPGQTFDVNSLSYGPGMMPKIKAQGSITNGVLKVGPVDLMLNLPTMNGDAALNIRRAQLEMNVTATTFSNGVLGGQLNVMELLNAIQTIAPDFAGPARGLLESAADLNNPTCDEISIALTFQGVNATKGTTRDAPAPTM